MAKANTPTIEVVSKHHGATGEYIGRGSPLGNPYSHQVRTRARYYVATRKEAIERYREMFERKLRTNDPVTVEEIERLARKARKQGHLKLLCFCAPNPCHGDVIKEAILAKLKQRKESKP